ncbi:hypothetical protein [Streptomyces sp. NPDC051173]|uniref:hypothetical protein n=1 Tax=Streptomyces sp. NPDC051173 TaxID=3155164 RepID=UPI00344F63E8
MLTSTKQGLRRAALPIVVCISILAGAHIAFNTNVFGPSRLCDNLVSAHDVQKAVGHPGRLSDHHSTSTQKDGQEFACSVQVEALLPGWKDVTLGISIEYTSKPDFPFSTPNWSNTPSDMAYFNGGGASDTNGWVLLPDKCWKNTDDTSRSTTRKIARVSITSGHGDRQGIARLLATAANSAAGKAGCASYEVPAPADLQLPAQARQSDSQATCSLPGFKMPKAVSSAAPHPWEISTNDIKSTWVCNLSQEKEDTPFFSFAISQDPALVSSLAQAMGSEKPIGTGWKVRGQIGGAIVTCGSKDTFLGMNTYAGGWTSDERDKLLPDESALFASFVKAAGSKLGCGGMAP